MNPFSESGGGDALRMRVLIVGNSGSGKSTLAKVIAERLGCTVTPMDSVYWIDQAALRKRGHHDAIATAVDVAENPVWVVEGVFGWIADVAAARATALVWLDMPWEVCRANLISRGPQAGESAEEFAGLLVWAEAYWTRTTGSSRAGHSRIFDEFTGRKFVLKSGSDVSTITDRWKVSNGSPLHR